MMMVIKIKTMIMIMGALTVCPGLSITGIRAKWLTLPIRGCPVNPASLIDVRILSSFIIQNIMSASTRVCLANYLAKVMSQVTGVALIMKDEGGFLATLQATTNWLAQ